MDKVIFCPQGQNLNKLGRDMRGIKDVWNMCIIKCIAHWNNANKGGGGNSGRNEITQT